MKLYKYSDEQTIASAVAGKIIGIVTKNPQATLGLATGSTQLAVYRALVADHRERNTSYRTVTTFNLDEYVGLDAEHEQSYHYYMRKNLFDHIDGDPDLQHIPNGLAADLEEECRRYDGLLDQRPIDLQLLGIGQNGHIGFNEPGSSFDLRTHVVELDRQTRVDNARNFAALKDVPMRAITMGIKDIMRAKRIVLVAIGPAKANAIKAFMHGPIGEDMPASALREHPHLEVYVDHEAGKYV
ncbi:MAG: glucosamine-6-phosphate deaminase [Acholeplasmataceae bacterium]